MLVLALTSAILATAPGVLATAAAQERLEVVRQEERQEARRQERQWVPRRVELRVSSPQLPKRGEPRVFAASRITDLEFAAVFAGRPVGSHLLELKLYTPRGYLYQVLTVPFSGTRGGRRRHVPGNPRVLAERELRFAGPGTYEVSARLPVAGSWITTSSLYGSWRVEAHVDGAVSPSGRKRFTIQQ